MYKVLFPSDNTIEYLVKVNKFNKIAQYTIYFVVCITL